MATYFILWSNTVKLETSCTVKLETSCKVKLETSCTVKLETSCTVKLETSWTVKLETSCTVILLPSVSVPWSTFQLTAINLTTWITQYLELILTMCYCTGLPDGLLKNWTSYFDSCLWHKMHINSILCSSVWANCLLHLLQKFAEQFYLDRKKSLT